MLLLGPMFVGGSGAKAKPKQAVMAVGEVGNCRATPLTPENCHTFVKQPKRSLHNQYLLASYGALRYAALLEP